MLVGVLFEGGAVVYAPTLTVPFALSFVHDHTPKHRLAITSTLPLMPSNFTFLFTGDYARFFAALAYMSDAWALLHTQILDYGAIVPRILLR